MSITESTVEPPRFGLPRGVVILLGLAATVVVVVGMRQVADILAPIFLALSLTITVYPARTWLERHRVPSWLATILVVLGIYVLLIALILSFALGIAKLAQILPEYADEIQTRIGDLQSWLADRGIGSDEVQDILKGFDYSALVGFVSAILGSLLSVGSVLVFLIALVLFMGLDTAMFTTRMHRVRGERQQALLALAAFAKGTRKYFMVSTVFGGIVAILDWLALVILGVPAALLWGILAFVTNYIPNIGFIIGLVPPALLALITSGPGTMLAVIIVYIVLNFVIQSIIQPKYMGDSVGLTTTVTFLSLIFWAYVLGPLGAILAVPMTLLAKATLVDFDPSSKWLQLFLGDSPNFDAPKRRRRRRRSRTSAPEDDDADSALPTDHESPAG
ncbi:AI-2E family transporter [Cumulibacter soli]|uniref:AI-2E family transporter n=1 Tax=Cumulibacter soli TaxID=2546344 RepID=UPI001419CB8A|nr:AI-2E family transporter [Cumulibacter soli]